jgi:hypothetical protein
MRRLRIIVALLLAVLWAPITSHCDFELFADLDILACGDHTEGSQGNNSHQPADCETDGCALIEDGFYKSESEPSLLGKPDWQPVPAIDAALVTAGPVKAIAATSITSENPHAGLIPWPVSLRAIPQPRAPSFVS